MKTFFTQGMIFLLMLFLFKGCGCNNTTNYSVSPSGSTESLQFNGIYQSEIFNKEYWQYFRFYEDGTVIAVSSTGTPSEIIDWFKKENIESKNLSYGEFETDNSELAFSIISVNGTVDYEGAIQENNLTLNFHSHINDTQGTRIYTFVQISE